MEINPNCPKGNNFSCEFCSMLCDKRIEEMNKKHMEELDNRREYLSYKKEGDTNKHTKPKNRRNKVKRKHR